MKIFFRVDASSLIGTGHVMRCLTLAKVLKKKGADCKFISRDHKNNLIKKIKKENFEVITLTSPNKVKSTQSTKDANLNYSDWIGTSWKEDVKQTIDALNKEKIDWLIIDHYGIDKKWEKKLRAHTKKIMIIDDLANRNHDCDLLLDQNLISNFKNRYQNLLPKECSTLLGPQYALLQNEYKDLHVSVPPRVGPIKRVLVYFGGTDQNNLTEIVLSKFLKLNRKNITLDIVISSNNPQKEKIKRLSKKNKNIKIYNELTSLAPLIIKADLAIGACGAVSWERCCLGLPAIVITIADNQKPIAKELHKQGLIRWLGHYDKITNNSVYDLLKNSIDQNLETWSKACKLVTDGCGAEKVASILALNSKTKLKPRFAKIDDEELLLNWANDPLVRANSFQSSIILKKDHKKWFYSCLKNPDNSKILIVETENSLPIGQVRITKKNQKWVIDFSLASFARRKRIGSKLLNLAITKFKEEGITSFFAEVKESNKASCKTFDKNGFIKKTPYKSKFITFFYQNKL